MQIFNLGIWEIFLVLLIMLIVLGPDNMMKTARDIGKFVSRMVKSPMWATFMTTSQEIRNLPTKIVREAGMEDTLKEIQYDTREFSREVKGELNQTAQTVNETASEISRHSVPYKMQQSNDSEPKEPEEVSAPLETDSAEEIEDMVEDAIEDFVPEDERSIAPPAIIETGEDVELEDFVDPALDDEPVDPAAPKPDPAVEETDVEVPPAIIEADSESFEDSIIKPAVDLSYPEPLEDDLIRKPLNQIPARRPGAPLPEDVPPPPVDLPGDEEDEEDNARE